MVDTLERGSTTYTPGRASSIGERLIPSVLPIPAGATALYLAADYIPGGGGVGDSVAIPNRANLSADPAVVWNDPAIGTEADGYKYLEIGWARDGLGGHVQCPDSDLATHTGTTGKRTIIVLGCDYTLGGGNPTGILVGGGVTYRGQTIYISGAQTPGSNCRTATFTSADIAATTGQRTDGGLADGTGGENVVGFTSVQNEGSLLTRASWAPDIAATPISTITAGEVIPHAPPRIGAGTNYANGQSNQYGDIVWNFIGFAIFDGQALNDAEIATAIEQIKALSI